ncbi:hypothetical protein [Brevundimonas sp.]|uniref:hypothetical protein n=1 Tax=Brevundimonas sp. TaxID=1871086 RepID=UPI0035AFBBD3
MSLTGRRLMILTEGDRRRGLGHVVRCGGYAEEWRARGGEVSWRIDGDDLAMKAAERLGTVEAGDWLRAPDDTVDADVAIVDSYALDPKMARRLADRAPAIVFMDDLQRIAYSGGLVVHPAPAPAPLRLDGGEWLCGPTWQPLRTAFVRPPSRVAVARRIGRVFVVMGGSDAQGLGGRVAETLARALPEAEIRLAGADEAPSGVVGLGRLTAESMAAEMTACDLAISAAGQTVFELARCGAPTVMLGVAENQRPNLEGWPPLVGFVNAGMWDAPDLEARLAGGCEALHDPHVRQAVSARAMAAVDGQGANRLIDRLEARWRTD